MLSSSHSIKRHLSIRKKVGDISLKDGRKNTYEIINNTKNQKCIKMPSDIDIFLSKNVYHTQRTIDTFEVAPRPGE